MQCAIRKPQDPAIRYRTRPARPEPRHERLDFQHTYYGDAGWTQPGHGCPVKARAVTCEYLRETGGFGCSIEDGYTLRLPVIDLVSGLGIR